ncbi:hypothetical protein [Micromonospora cathayae]|uniref:Uncharacterized protein n=1 Tax=Micromonospora cathayae TaxID=3028804 RepID=A0ABY7ZVH0_9ACTN|nr:hypothetical protein [Micromonospora sp. HUAS 3]WDZ86980.1 hypothetical protein PVK37_11550 [Micromonospora sp. HUAS 3]
MTVRRGVARLVVVGALLGGVSVVGATPALADGDTVRVRASGTFTAGGSPGSVSVEVRRRTEGCVLLRTGLRIRLEGVRADQVEAQVSVDGQWWPVPVSAGDVLTTQRTSPANPTLCKGKSVTVRYRLAFLPGAPAGRLTVAGEAVTATGQLIGRNADTSQVKAGRNASPSPTPTKKPTPTPSPEVTEEPAAGDPAIGPTLAAVGSGGGQAAEEAGSGGGLSMVMVFGVGLVVVGLGLIVLLFRRSRADRRDDTDSSFAGPPEIPLPRNPGGTTYRSGGGQPGAGPPAGYPVPGTQAGYPGTPARGTVYPSGSGAGAQPPGAGYPSGTGYPPGAATGGQPPGTGYAGGGHPAPGQLPPSGTVYPSTGRPGTPPPPEAAGGGDSTTVMPRLPE